MSAPSLQRRVAFEVVRATFEDAAFTDRAFRVAAEREGLDGRERAQAQWLAFGSVQRRGTADALIRRLAGRSPRLLDPPVRAALRLGLYEILFGRAGAEHAAVDQAVELTRAAGAGQASGLVNAVLRRALRERRALRAAIAPDGTPQQASIAHSVPRWLAEKWWAELGAADARSLLAACNRPQPRGLRVNTLRARREEVEEGLRSAGVEVGAPGGPWPLAPAECLVVQGALGVAVDLVERGVVVPQSLGSAAVVEVLDPRPAENVLDLCAGPGIKTGQIAARIGGRGEVISVEADPERAAEVAEWAQRLGSRSVTVIEADAAGPALGREFDRVLVDAPCSDLGTLATRPDVRWRKSPEMIEELREVQRGILLAAAAAVRPGGRLVYSTCTISRPENEEQVAWLESVAGPGGAPTLRVEDLGAAAPGLASAADRRCLQLRPDRDRTTGFFIARLRRDD